MKENLKPPGTNAAGNTQSPPALLGRPGEMQMKMPRVESKGKTQLRPMIISIGMKKSTSFCKRMLVSVTGWTGRDMARLSPLTPAAHGTRPESYSC